jgi:hypothetical protein
MNVLRAKRVIKNSKSSVVIFKQMSQVQKRGGPYKQTTESTLNNDCLGKNFPLPLALDVVQWEEQSKLG